jgi:hypothetical protein
MPISYDESRGGAIDLPDEQDCFIFDGQAEHRVTALLANQSSRLFSLRLSKPDGSSWFCNFTSSVCEVDDVMLPASGSYTLTVDAYTTGTGPYSLTLNRLDGNEEAISYGQTLNRELELPGDQDSFVLAGVAGQRVGALVKNQTNGLLGLRLTKPDGSVIACNFTSSVCELNNISLLTTGNYTLTVDAYRDAIGPYSLTLNRLDEDAETISYGVPLGREISPAGEQDSFVFQAEAGTAITALVDNQLNGPIAMLLLKPDGTSSVCGFTSGLCQIDGVTLVESGSYTLTVDGSRDATGGYTIVLNRLNGDEVAIEYGQTLGREIAPAGDRDSFTFQGEAGQRVTALLDGQASRLFYLRLVAPEGTNWSCGPSYECQIDNVMLPASGSYTLTVDGYQEHTAAYTLSLTRVDGDDESLGYNESLARDINPIGDQDRFIFEGGAGQQVTAYLDNLSGRGLSLHLLAPTGISWVCGFSSGDCQIDELTLPATGRYTITVDGSFDATGSYSLVVNRLDGDERLIEYGQIISDEIAPVGDQDNFYFAGVAGQQVTARLASMVSVSFNLRLLTPNGTSWRCNFSSTSCQIANVTLPATGRYTMTVDGSNAAIGHYTLALSEFTSTATPTVSATATATPRNTPSETPSLTPNATRTETATPSPTTTLTPTASSTATATPTSSTTEVPSETATATTTAIAMETETPTPFPSETASATPTSSETATTVATPTLEVTATPSVTATATDSPTPNSTETPSSTPTTTTTATITVTMTVTGTATGTATTTASATATVTSVPTATSPTYRLMLPLLVRNRR